MKENRTQNEKPDERLDEVGRKLLKTTAISENELEKIVSAPHILAGIKARIAAEAAEQQNLPAPVLNTRPSFSRLSSIFSWQGGVAAFAVILIAAAVVFSVLMAEKPGNNGAGIIAKNTAPQTQPDKDAVKPVISDAGPAVTVQDRDEDRDEEGTGDDVAVRPVQLFYRETSKKTTALKTNFKKRASPMAQITDSDRVDHQEGFYSLTFTGNGEEVTAGSRVVRVDMPRSSLFAMGVDIPAENASETIKTDLLISSDGVTRGFRIVK